MGGDKPVVGSREGDAHGLSLACVLCEYDELATGVSSMMSHKCLKPNTDPTLVCIFKYISQSHDFVAHLAAQ